MISRRDFLKLVPTTLVSSLAGLPKFENLVSANKVYKGANLQGWTVALGDAIYARSGEPPVTIADIATLHYPTYSELRANIHRRIIMAHNITFKRIIDPAARTYIHTCTFYFRLPYIPSPDVNSLWNAQTLEAGIFVWDGYTTRRDYGMAFQWSLNPWNEFGKLRIWSDKTSSGMWLDTGATLTPDMNWHQATMVVDFKRGTTAFLIDGKRYLAQFTRTTKPANWGTEVAARFQLEIVSIDPEPSGIKAMHRAQFKNWNWLWEPASSAP
jgi:hypothetical protein